MLTWANRTLGRFYTRTLRMAYRISSEERMLVATLGQDYRDYLAKTWRLIPLLY